MKSVRVFVVLFLSVFVVAPSAFSQDRPQVASEMVNGERAALVAHLFAVTNLVDSVEVWRSVFLAQDVSECGCASGEDAKALIEESWGTAVAREFDSAKIVAHLRGAYVKAFNVDELQSLIAYSESPVGRKLAEAAKTQAQKPMGEAAEMNELAMLLQAAEDLEKDPARAAIIKRVMAKLEAKNTLVDSMVNIAIGTAVGSVQALSEEERARVDTANVINQIEANRHAMAEMVDAILEPTYNQYLHAFSLDDLEQYDAWLSTPLARRAIRVDRAGFDASMRERAIAIGMRFAKEMKAVRL